MSIAILMTMLPGLATLNDRHCAHRSETRCKRTNTTSKFAHICRRKFEKIRPPPDIRASPYSFRSVPSFAPAGNPRQLRLIVVVASRLITCRIATLDALSIFRFEIACMLKIVQELSLRRSPIQSLLRERARCDQV